MSSHIISRDLTPVQLCELSVVWFSAMRRMGFTPDEIFFSPYIQCDPGIIVWGIVVRAGGKQWSSAIGLSTEDADTFSKRWLLYTQNEMQKLSDAEMHALWVKHMPVRLLQGAAISIMDKGLPLRVPGV